MEKAPLGTTAKYSSQQAGWSSKDRGGQRIESGSVGRHEWSFGRRGSVMTQEVLRVLPGRGSCAGRASLSLRWIKASRVMSLDESEEDVDGHCEI